jgi:hypothetical protein
MLTDRGTTSSQHSHPSPPKLHGQTTLQLSQPDAQIVTCSLILLTCMIRQAEHLQHSVLTESNLAMLSFYKLC